MTIEQLDEKRLLIALCSKDMEMFALEFDSMSLKDSHTRQVLKKLLQLAGAKTGLHITNKSLVIEVMQHKDGCLILITIKNQQEKRRTYKIKRSGRKIMFFFENSEELLTVIEKLYVKGKIFESSDCYRNGNGYYLILTYSSISPCCGCLLGEYASESSKSLLDIARVKESCIPVCRHTAILTIGSALVNE